MFTNEIFTAISPIPEVIHIDFIHSVRESIQKHISDKIIFFDIYLRQKKNKTKNHASQSLLGIIRKSPKIWSNFDRNKIF